MKYVTPPTLIRNSNYVYFTYLLRTVSQLTNYLQPIVIITYNIWNGSHGDYKRYWDVTFGSRDKMSPLLTPNISINKTKRTLPQTFTGQNTTEGVGLRTGDTKRWLWFEHFISFSPNVKHKRV